MEGQSRVGRHTCAFSEPDTVVMELAGFVSQEEGKILNALHAAMGGGREHLFFLIDLGRFDGMHAEVRQEAGLTMKNLPLRGIVVHGASLKARVVAKLIVGAMNLFKQDAERAPLIFTEDQEHGLAWIDQRRRELRGAA